MVQAKFHLLKSLNSKSEEGLKSGDDLQEYQFSVEIVSVKLFGYNKFDEISTVSTQ